MGSITGIDWCDSTFNPWIGCMKVSKGCDNCYAETLMDKRYHRVAWGQRKTATEGPSVGTRVRTSQSNWAHPRRWQREHEAFYAKFGHRRRVFCSSLADVYDNQVPAQWRRDLFTMICDTPDLDWLLLTKRPENIARLTLDAYGSAEPPVNVWLGTTAEDQEAYDKRWPILRGLNPVVKFISYEPALGHLTMAGHHGRPDWLICGGESGPGYRAMDQQWASSIKHECIRDGVKFFLKQMAGKQEIPADLMLREWPEAA